MKLALGTAQFGMKYGISNISGKTSFQEAARILSTAKLAGIDTIDTAAVYGDSELVLGQIGVSDWHIVSKVPPMRKDIMDGDMWVRHSVQKTLDRLQINRLDGMLLHSATDLLGPQGRKIAMGLQNSKAEGFVAKVGVSIYSPHLLTELIDVMPLDIIQAPFNVIDQRLATSGWLDRLVDAGVEVHIRSVFLQGLLLMCQEKRPSNLNKWSEVWKQWDKVVEGDVEKALALCLGAAKSQPAISRVIVGVEKQVHLEHLLAIWEKVEKFDAAEFSSDDPQLVEPSNWKTV
jgi:aryl-alcohol dehydrogenase-like predicted oxidoreductase